MIDIRLPKEEQKQKSDFVQVGEVIVPREKFEAWQQYAKRLRAKFPHMKEERLKRKVAEYFKIKLS